MLQNNGVEVHHAFDDADTLAVITALEKALDSSVSVIADDTAILMFLFYKTETFTYTIFLVSMITNRIWEIKDSKLKIGTQICESLLIIHAISGCATTSRVHSVGKALVLKKCLNDNKLLSKMEEFSKDLTKTEVVDIGLAILLKLLNVKKEKSLMKGGQQSILKKYLHLKRILFIVHKCVVTAEEFHVSTVRKLSMMSDDLNDSDSYL